REVVVGIVELRRDGVGAEPRRNTAGGADRAQRAELCLTVESVARLGLERRRAVTEHRVPVSRRGGGQLGLARRPRRADRREDAAARRMELLVGRAARAQRELLDAVTGERSMRVAVDEPGDRALTAAVDLLDVTVQAREVAHAADARDRLAVDEDVRVVDD